MTRPNCYARRADLDTRLVDGEAFVITRTTIQHLNPVATLIWLVLEQPSPHRMIVDVLEDVYPRIGRSQLSRDTSRIVRQLRSMNLIVTEPRD
jgi:hypothetical protein